MNRYILLIVLLSLSKTASADQLDGFESLNAILILAVFAAISAIVLVFSLFTTIVSRLAQEEFKVSIGINFSCSTLIICSLIALAFPDPGFRLACLGIIVVSGVLIYLNYTVGSKRSNDDHNKEELNN